MLEILARVVVVAFGLFLIGLSGTLFAGSAWAQRFLEAFASSARAHFTEQAIRLVFGAALVMAAPAMWQAEAFRFVGWIVIATSVGLLLVPWRWHHRFAASVIPLVLRYQKLYAVGVLAFGGLLVFAVVSGPDGMI